VSVLAATGVSVTLGGREVVRGVTAEVRGGELVGLLGPNGAGKSTLVRALAGLLAPDAGRVTLDGIDIADRPRRALARTLAYLPQGAQVHWPVAVERLVALGRLPHLSAWQRPRGTDRAAVDAALRAADIEDLRGRPATELSGGEAARVLLARVLAAEPGVLLADEPVAALDPRHQLALMELLHSRAARGTAVMVVLHDLGLAARFCDRLVLMHEGRVLREGVPEHVLSPEALAEAYGVEARIERRNGTLSVTPWRVIGGRVTGGGP